MITVPHCSTSPPTSATPWPSWLAGARSLVAETLTGGHDPLAAWLRPQPAAPPQAVAAALARALLPPTAAVSPPSWLRADQQLSFSRALAAVLRYRGALLADRVGTGKTFIGLAVAGALDPRAPIHVLAPAALIPQWREAARRVNVAILPHSHELLSRGRLPPATSGPVLIDESHRFRTPSTKRYESLAPWCVGRRGLLLSATPVVNRLEDLAHQLLLLVRDDALAWAGVASLGALDAARRGGGGAGSLAHLVVTGEDRTAELPATGIRERRPQEPGDSPFETIRLGLVRLRLSRDRVIAGLLRGVLLAAMASSPQALADALARYRSLLQHARDAAAAGHPVSRHTIRRMVGAEEQQLVFWPLVAEELPAAELAVGDLEATADLARAAQAWAARADAKARALQEVLRDEKPSLVFTQATATVRYLRRQLGRGIAWCTGQGSGLDATSLPRDTVLDWFRRPSDRDEEWGRRPKVLVATDVAAEGLDLPLVRRVVHYDLPWTAVRLQQRSGRAIRLSSRPGEIEVVRFLPPPALERTLQQEAILNRKAGLPAELGLGEEANAPWRVRAMTAARWAEVPEHEGGARVPAAPGEREAVVAGVRLVWSDGSHRPLVLARQQGRWRDDPGLIARLLDRAYGVTAPSAPAPAQVRRVRRQLTGPVRAALRASHGMRLAGAPSRAAQRLSRRVLALSRQAARSRDRQRLSVLSRGLAWLHRGHTAGETLLLEQWRGGSYAELLAHFERLGSVAPEAEVTRVELIGLLVVEGSSEPD